MKNFFFCMIAITNTMSNTENRDFVLIFSEKGLIGKLFRIYITHNEIPSPLGRPNIWLACTLSYDR